MIIKGCILSNLTDFIILTFRILQKLSEKLGKGDEKLDCEVILKFLKLVLKVWGDELNARDTQTKRAFRGKLASATHTQTVDYIKPLFRKLKKKVYLLLDIVHYSNIKFLSFITHV